MSFLLCSMQIKVVPVYAPAKRVLWNVCAFPPGTRQVAVPTPQRGEASVTSDEDRALVMKHTVAWSPEREEAEAMRVMFAAFCASLFLDGELGKDGCEIAVDA